MRNLGKLFEEDFKKSVPSWCWIYRLKDGTANFQGSKNENVRFQAHNICDFVVMGNKYLYLLELKSVAGNSIPFANFRDKQIIEMNKVDKDNIQAYFIINFRSCERTVAMKANDIKKYINNSKRKSIPVEFAVKNGIQISSILSRTRFKYDLANFFQ